jgi:hypothetical protein
MLTPEEQSLICGLWVQHRRLAIVAAEVGLSERTIGRRLRAANVEMPGRGRPKGVKDSPCCDRQIDKQRRQA